MGEVMGLYEPCVPVQVALIAGLQLYPPGWIALATQVDRFSHPGGQL